MAVSPRPVEGWTGHRPAVAFRVDARRSAAADRPGRGPPAVDVDHRQQDEVSGTPHRYRRRRLHLRRLRTRAESPRAVNTSSVGKKTLRKYF